MWIQILARPVDDDWHKNSRKQIARIKGGSFRISHLVKAPFQAPDGTSDLSEREKITHQGYRGKEC